VSETRTPADPYDALIKSYYGGHHHHHHRHRRGRRQATVYEQGSSTRDRFRGEEVEKSANRLLASYYGRRRARHDAEDEQRPPVEISFSMDDGETLERAAREEYVIEAAFDEAVFEEYVVEPSAIAREASLSDGHSVQAVDPRDECQLDLTDPLAAAKGADCASHAPAAQGMPAAPGKSEPSADSAPAAPAPAASAAQSIAPDLASRAPSPPAPSDDDFISDMQAILTRQKVYDPVTKKTVEPDKLAKGAAADPQPGEGTAVNNSQAIFDKIAHSMQYANKYDLGTVELENRFADFDRMSDLQRQADARKRAAPATDKPVTAVATAVDSQDFIQDLDAIQHQRGARGSRSDAGDDPFAFVPASPDDQASTSPAPAATAGAPMPAIQIPDIQIPNIQMPSVQMPAMPTSASLSTSTSTDLGAAFVSASLQTLFSRAADINNHFANQGATDFIDWFNRNLARHAPWEGRAIGSAAQVATNFQAIWNKIPQIFGSAQINLLQFVALMSIFINEVGGMLAPISEKVGTKEHPGLAYAFDSIPGAKVSYNDGGSNWTAYRCFRDPDFIAAHRAKALGAQLQNTSDTRWGGHAYPAGSPTDPNPALAGFIMEADFFKFRGRGLIQTTWRSAYLNLIRFVQGYAGAQPEILARKSAWAGMDPDKAANLSSNDDWDALFMKTDLEIPCVAIAQHSAAAGHYLNLASDVAVLNGKGMGSIWRMGKSISGADSYADLFRRRVVAICNLLGN
jgi:hypothetical protein